MTCPECREGKHQNCDGVADIDDNDKVTLCECDKAWHPLRPKEHPGAAYFKMLIPDYPTSSEPIMFQCLEARCTDTVSNADLFHHAHTKHHLSMIVVDASRFKEIV